MFSMTLNGREIEVTMDGNKLLEVCDSEGNSVEVSHDEVLEIEREAAERRFASAEE